MHRLVGLMAGLPLVSGCPAAQVGSPIGSTQPGASGSGLATTDSADPAATRDSASGTERVPGWSIAGVVINELHYDPDLKTDFVEFVELVNPTDEAVDLTGWALCDGVELVFPEGTVLAGGAHLVAAQDPEALASIHGVAPSAIVGPVVGKLRNSGETVALCSAEGVQVDRVDYQLGFPWPTVGDPADPAQPGSGFSIQLAHPDLDNGLGGSWRSAAPTPAARNEAVYTADLPPQIRQVEHTPSQPEAGEPVTVSARITDPQGVSEVVLQVQVVEPGSYIGYQISTPAGARVPDLAYEEGWVDWPMAEIGDGVFAVELPASNQEHRRLIRYRISATDTGGQHILVPYGDDPQPNFAYFVYDGVPAWTGADQPGRTSPVVYGAELMGALPVYHLISRSEDVLEAQYAYIDYRSEEAGWYQWTGALVYDGVVYDHIWYRNRGWWSAYEWGKNKWKFDFNRGHDFQALDNTGDPYPRAWDKMNYSACFLPADYNPHRGEHGLFEAVGYRLFELVGVPAPRTHWVHHRVIDSPEEASDSQFEGDFWGLYLVIEQPDGRFLDARGLADGNVYKMAGVTASEWTSPTNQGPTQVTDMSDLWDFIDTYQSQPGIGWWEESAELEAYLSYRVIVEALHHYDIPDGWNSVYYHHPETADRGAHWWMLPWDVDLTWDCCIYANDTEPFQQIFAFAGLELAYRNRAREIRDLLVNGDQGAQLIDDFAAVIGDSGFVAADRAMWDHHPRNADPGLYYTSPPGDFTDMVQYMKTFIGPAGWGGTNLDRIALDMDIPDTPSIVSIGAPDHPLDDLRFEAGAFSDPQGDASFAAMQWRVGAVSPGHYEIEAVWESAVLKTFEETITVPPDVLESGRAYQVRVRMQDDTGRWSHWSDPIAFTPL